MGLCLIALTLDWTLLFVILKVTIGLGMVIFVHELGHFAVAKMCGVRCDKFYLGFDIAGLKLCKFKWGETEYGIGILPLGGYVKMLGQEDNPARLKEELERAKLRQEQGDQPEDESDAREAVDLKAAEQALFDPRSYLAKSVPKRMAIISAGVIMNVIFAFVMAAVAYKMGVEQVRCGVGQVVPGSAAWRAHLETGDRIVAINGREAFQFGELKAGVSLGDLENGVPMVIQRPESDKDLNLTLIPDMADGQPMPTIGITPPLTTTLADLKDQIPALPGTPAYRAEPPLQGGDQIVEIDGQKIETYAQIEAQLARNRDKPLSMVVLRKPSKKAKDKADQAEKRVEITIEPNPMRRLGLVMKMGPITAIQADSPAAAAGIQPGDRIERIDGQAPGDPMTLPDRLRERVGQTLTLTLARKGAPRPIDVEVTSRRADWISQPMFEGNPMPVPELGITYDVESRVEAVVKDGPGAKQGLKPGDVVLRAKILPPKDLPEGEKQEPVELEFGEGSANWPSFLFAIQERRPGSPVELTLEGDRTVTLAPQASDDWFNPERGFTMRLQAETFTRVAKTYGEAIRLGVRETFVSVEQVLLFVQKIGTQVSPRAFAGPVTIIKVAGLSAYAGTAQLLMFLTLLSANLAVINFLPIPVLDGGHFVFLAYEGIRGKPADERVQLTLSYLGLLFILGLMVWVIGLDLGWISR